MELATASIDQDMVIAVSGRVDALESAALAAKIESQLDACEAHVIVDLFDVDYIDSSGLAVLVRTWRRQTDDGRRYSIRLPGTEDAKRVFSLTGFDLVFDIIDEIPGSGD